MTKIKFNSFKIHLITHFLLLNYYISHVLNIDHRLILFGLKQLYLQICIQDNVFLMVLSILVPELATILLFGRGILFVYTWEFEN